MAEILIKGMEMPKECADCRLFAVKKLYNGFTDMFEEHAFCTANHSIQFNDFDIDSIRHPDCPLKEIPTHGRLIDADILLNIVREEADFPSDEWCKVIECIENAPTIIEAGEERE